jgi:hypothetical protein
VPLNDDDIERLATLRHAINQVHAFLTALRSDPEHKRRRSSSQGSATG